MPFTATCRCAASELTSRAFTVSTGSTGADLCTSSGGCGCAAAVRAPQEQLQLSLPGGRSITAHCVRGPLARQSSGARCKIGLGAPGCSV